MAPGAVIRPSGAHLWPECWRSDESGAVRVVWNRLILSSLLGASSKWQTEENDNFGLASWNEEMSRHK
jgi:hypothetical protein